MKKILIYFSFLFFFVSGTVYASELAVIPYKIENPGKTFPVEKGQEYAKYIGVGSSVKKGLEYFSYYQTITDLKKNGVRPEKNLTLSDVKYFAKTRMIDYVISGTILRTTDGFLAKSILFSRHAGKVIATSSVKAYTLKDLAEKDIDSLFSYIISEKGDNNKLESYQNLILIDNSYNSSEELNDIKTSLIDFSGSVINNFPGSEFYIYPFYSNEHYRVGSDKTPAQIENSLKKINSGNKSSSDKFIEVLLKGLNTIRWKKNTKKSVIVFTTSEVRKNSLFQRAILKANRNKIKVYVVMLGGVSVQSDSLYSEISERTGGKAFDVCYSQKLYDKTGKAFHLYYERRRLFLSELSTNEWKKGILNYYGRNRFSGVRKSNWASELIIKNDKDIKNPSFLSTYYKSKYARVVIDQDKAQNNLDYILRSKILPSLITGQQKVLARVQLLYMKTSLWIDVYNEQDLKFFKQKKNSDFSLIIGLNFLKNNKNVYGYSVGSKVYTNFMIDQIPSTIVKNLPDFLKNIENYYSDGFLSPSIWFFEVKVGQIIEKYSSTDIRGG